MNIEITEADFKRVYSNKEIEVELKGLSKDTLGAKSGEITDIEEKRKNAVIDALPRVLADKMERIMPKDWTIKEIVLKINIGGKPFGVGLEGDATVKFGPT
jgi:hypothetical protein